MTVALAEASPVDLGQAAQTFHVELIDRLVELGEVSLDAGIRKVGQRLGPEFVDDRTQLTYDDASNMCSSVTNVSARPQ